MTQEMTSAVGTAEAEETEGGPALQATASTRSRTLLQRGIEIAVSLACLFLALRVARPADLLDAVRHAALPWILAFVAVTLVVLVLKAWRWQLLFYPEHQLPFNSLFSILCVAYMVSNVLPGRVGELARVALVPAEQPVSAARTLSTIVVERLLDLLSVLLLLVVLLPFVRLPADMAHAAQALGAAALLGAAGMILFSYRKDWLLGMAHRLLAHIGFLNRSFVYDGIAHLLDGFAMLRSPFGLAVIGLALLSWAGVVGMGWTAALAFHIAVPVTAIGFAVVLTSLAMLLPSTPGYVGVFNLAAKMALLPLGVPVAVAEVYSFAWWGINYLTLSATGAVAMWVHGISFRQVLKWRKSR